jgi:hypothetical protein
MKTKHFQTFSNIFKHFQTFSKLLITLTFVGLAGNYSCVGIDPTAPSLDKDGSLKLIQGVRNFSTVDDYESVLQNHKLEDLPGFVSYSMFIADPFYSNSESSRVVQENELLSDFSDAFILDILDSYGMVIIEDYLIKLDFKKRLVLATKNIERIKDFKKESYNYFDVKSYDFNEDVLGILYNEDNNLHLEKNYNENARLMSNGCPGNYSVGSTPPPMIGDDCDSRKCQWTSIWREAGWIYKVEAKHVYQAAGIYFRLKSEMAHFKRNEQTSGFWSSEPNPGMTITYWGSYTPKNRSTVNLSSCYDQCQGCGPIIANTDKVQKIHWESGRSLTDYNLYGIYEAHLGGAHAPSGYPDAFQLFNIKK